MCLVPGPSGLGWFHPLFWDGSNPSHVWLIVLGWVGSIPFFCLVGGIGKKGQMVYLTPFATVLMGPTVSVTPYLLPHHRIRAPPRALPPPPPPPAPPATRRRRGRPRLRPRPRVPLAEHAADLRRSRPRPRTPLAQPAADLRRPRPWPRAPLTEPAADLRRPGPRPRALLAEPAPTSAAPARGRAGQAVRRPGHAVGGGAGQAD